MTKFLVLIGGFYGGGKAGKRMLQIEARGTDHLWEMLKTNILAGGDLDEIRLDLVRQHDIDVFVLGPAVEFPQFDAYVTRRTAKEEALAEAEKQQAELSMLEALAKKHGLALKPQGDEPAEPE